MTLDLAQARVFQSPKDVFVLLSNEAETLNVERFDVYGDFSADASASWMRGFEHHIADYLGHEDGLFLPSGVMAQMIMLCVNRERSTCKYRDTFLCHYSSHLLVHEQDSFSELLKMNAAIISPQTEEEIQSPLKYTDVETNLTLSTPSTIIIECPHREIGGKCTPLEDLKAISTICREKGIRLHMDGARLWEASAYYCSSSTGDEASPSSPSITIKELCALFDSVYVSFYKGLGGLTGAMLLGDKAFIALSRVWLRRFGGNLFTLTPYALSAYTGFQKNVDSFQARKNRLQEVIAIVTRVANEEAAESSCRPLVRFDPPVPVVSLIHVYLNAADVKLALLARGAAASLCGIVAISPNLKVGRFGAAGQVYFEMNMGPANMGISDADWEGGWKTFLTTLRKVLKDGETGNLG